MLYGVYCFAVLLWTREIGLVFLLSVYSANALKKIRGNTHSTSSRCAACKLNTMERSDDLSNYDKISF